MLECLSDDKKILRWIKKGQYARALLSITATRPITLEEAANAGLSGVFLRDLLAKEPELRVRRIDGVRCLTSRLGLQHEVLKSSQFSLNRFYDHVIAPLSRNTQQCYELMLLATSGDISGCIKILNREGRSLFIPASRFARAGLTSKEVKVLYSLC